jgi:hypothetical protein
MHLDVRVPLGWLFLTLGIILVIYGLAPGSGHDARSLDANLNLRWGVIFALFGGVVLILAHRKKP